MNLTRSQVEQLGIRLVRASMPDDADVAMLHELLLTYERVLERTVARVRDQVDALPTSRIKNTGTILEKLDRHGGSWLKSIQDIAGMRIVGSFDRGGQDELAAHLVSLFSAARRRPRVTDRRARPMHGYTAVHVVVYPDGFPVEIQVRTRWQHEWADLFEKLADQMGRSIRYGETPVPWLSPEARADASSARREFADICDRLQQAILRKAGLVSSMIGDAELLQARTASEEEQAQARLLVEELLRSVREDLDYLRRLNERHQRSTITP